MAGAARTRQRRHLRSFYQEALSEAERWEWARQMEGLNEEIALLVRRELLALEMVKETPDEVKVRGLCERRIINEWENGKIGPVAIKTMSGEYVKGGR